jgi:hypothetical protein
MNDNRWSTDLHGHKWLLEGPEDDYINANTKCTYCEAITGSINAGRMCPCSPTASTGVSDLVNWWNKTSAEDGTHALKKAAEYGSADLEIMGKAMEALYHGASELDPESRRRVGIEMAIAFYLMGKSARMFGAYARGTVPSDDTWHDATVYPMMARRVRDSGQWP